MSADPDYDDAVSRVISTSKERENEPVYSVALETDTDELKYSEDDIIEALEICQKVEDAVAEEREYCDRGETVIHDGHNEDTDMSDPVYRITKGTCICREQQNNNELHIVEPIKVENLADEAQFLGNNDSMLDPVYKGSNEAWNMQSEQIINETGDRLKVDSQDENEPVYHDAAETLNNDLTVQLRPTSVFRRGSQDPDNVYSFAKEPEHISDQINKRHGVHGENTQSVHGDAGNSVAKADGSEDQFTEQTEENKYISLKDVVVNDSFQIVPKLPASRSGHAKTAKENKPPDDSSKSPRNSREEGDYEFVDYSKVKKSKRLQPRTEAVVHKKVLGQKQSGHSQKKTSGLMISEKDRKAAKQKSKALKRSGRPFDHHGALQDPKAGAIGELEDSDNLTDYANPFTVSSDDSYESFTDSSFDSWASDSSDDSFHSSEERHSNKPLPQPPPRKKKGPHLKNIIHPHHHHTHVKTADEPTILPFVSNTPRPLPALPDPPDNCIMSQAQMKLRQVLESLANSEKSYIESLERLHKEYSPIFDKFGILSKSEVNKLFETVKDILSIHKIGQIELGEKLCHWYAHEKIGALFGFFSKEMVISPYSEYVNHYESVSEIIKETMSSKAAFLEELKTKQCSSSDRLSLAGLMLKPIQRFPQFIMIIKDILKHTPKNHHDRENLQEGLTGIENVAHQLNEGKRRSEQKFHGQEIISRLSPKLPVDKKAYLIRQDDVKQLSEDHVGVHTSQTKTRRLFLLNDKLVSVSVTQREQDGHLVDKFTYKWSQKLEDLELQMSADMPHMIPRVTGVSPLNIASPKIEGKDDDPFQLASDLSDMLHDVNVLGRIGHLASTLKWSYQGFSEETVQKLITDIQAQIQNKDYQLQLLNSSSIILRDRVKSKKYVFETASPAVKQEWTIDFMLTKFALDVVNIPSWYEHDSTSSVVEMPAFLMKHMSVDMQRTYCKIKCAIPVYLPVSSEGSVEHLWVCSSTESAGQVSIISLHTPKPNLVMSFKATDCDIEAVVMVPGFAMENGPTIFEEDTVWISTAKSEISVFMLHENLVKQDSSKKLTSNQELTQFVHKFKPGCVIISMVYQDDCVFCGTRNGTVIVYGRDDVGAWGSSGTLKLCDGFSVTSMLSIGEGVWAACGKRIFIIGTDNLDEYKIQDQIDVQIDNQIPNTEVQCITKAGVGVWASFYGQSKLFLYHIESKKFLQEVDISPSVNNFISVFSSSKETRKDYQVSCLVASLGLLWVGTSDGIILTYPLPRLRDGVPKIHKRPQVSFHGHNGPVKFLLPVHYGLVNGAPLKRKVSSILKKSDSESKSRGQEEKNQNCTEKQGQNNETLYESVRLSKGSQHEYESNMNIHREDEKSGDNVKISENGAQSQVSANIKSNGNVEGMSVKQEPVEHISENAGSNQDLQASAEHTYFILEPQSGSKDKNEENQNYIKDNENKTASELQNVAENNAAIKTGVQKQLSFHSELAKKILERKEAKEIQEAAVDEAEIDDLYGFLKSETKVNSSTMQYSGNYSDRENVNDLQGSLYRRYNFERPFEAKKPSGTSVKRRTSFKTTNAEIDEELERRESKKRHRVGSSFSKGSSVDTLRKQDTKTMLVVSGGNGYKDWKKRQSYQYRTDEACLVVWMYKV